MNTLQRWQAVLAISIVLMAVVLGWHVSRTPRPTMPTQRPLADAQPWMADTVPGVGPKTRERITADLRAGRWDSLPNKAKMAISERFLVLVPMPSLPDEKETKETK